MMLSLSFKEQDSLLRAREKFLKPATGLMFPSHTTMYFAPVEDDEERRQNNHEYSAALADWADFQDTTKQVYGVNMQILQKDFDREQKEYYLWSSRWRELPEEAVLCEPKAVKTFDMMTCTIEDSKGLTIDDPDTKFSFDIDGNTDGSSISGFAGWFTADFKSRTDEGGANAPTLPNPAFLSTGPENGYTHWGQQVFYFHSGLPLLKGQTTRMEGHLEMYRTKENARLYNCRITCTTTRRKIDDKSGAVLMKSGPFEQIYLIP